MNEQIFRKKSLERIESPESLNDYVKVTRPSVWLLLAAIIVLFVGAFLWATFGHIDTTVPSTATITGGVMNLTVTDKEKLPNGYNGQDARLVIDNKSYNISLTLNADGTFTSKTELPEDLTEGSYNVDIVVESVSPIVYIFNN